ncbi:hypothetical protein [Radiobacillus deserti]|uniref:Uncharacterized protein n=1 Tax=Radiobacillus deserti TaxID=2594883 RepID=A0A516KES3_9BACI|nr:hypothetical protein [Radiobacillus deserti]QDP39904.1 hypothetical protein FN924_06825 [Radiobacillus deserti]
MREPELEAVLKKFDKLLRQYPDHLDHLGDFKSFLRSFLRVRTHYLTLPTSEVISIIKHEKPTIYYSLKANLKDDPIFGFITQLDMSYELAKENLETIKNK